MPRKSKSDTIIVSVLKGCSLTPSEQKIVAKRVELALKGASDVIGQTQQGGSTSVCVNTPVVSVCRSN